MTDVGQPIGMLDVLEGEGLLNSYIGLVADQADHSRVDAMWVARDSKEAFISDVTHFLQHLADREKLGNIKYMGADEWMEFKKRAQRAP